MKKQQKQIYHIIDNILWESWNPIGNVPRDEYQGYVPQIFKLKIEGADKFKIAKQLYEFETINMGLHGNMEHCEYVAEKILDIKLT